MGRTGKATTSTIKVTPESTDNKECVSVDAISELMKDFTCASLLTKANQCAAKGQMSSVKEAHAKCCEEIVSSLKHFHLKTPVNKRTRLKEKKNLERRSKTVLENKFNLSVAAIHCQTSVVWPGKLNGLSNKRTDPSVDVIIRPSRLSIPGITDNTSRVPSLSSPIHTSSSEEKARIAATLCSQNVPRFGDFDLKGKEDGTGTHCLSFSKLCNRNSNPGASVSITSTSCPLPTSVKSQAYRNRKTHTASGSGHIRNAHTVSGSGHIRNAALSTNHNQSCSSSARNVSCLGHKHTAISHSPIANSSHHQHQQQHHHQTPSPSPSCYTCRTNSIAAQSLATDDVIANNNNNDTHPSAYPYPQPLTPNPSSSNSISASGASAGFTSERSVSCSEEMRMEESNVNELASYFEDLLHIPRKMSVMAEMMYA